MIIPSGLIMIYQRVTSNVNNVQDNFGMIWKKHHLLKEIYLFVRSLNKMYNESGDWIFGVCKYFVRKLTGYFFTIIDEETESIQN